MLGWGSIVVALVTGHIIWWVETHVYERGGGDLFCMCEQRRRRRRRRRRRKEYWRQQRELARLLRHFFTDKCSKLYMRTVFRYMVVYHRLIRFVRACTSVLVRMLGKRGKSLPRVLNKNCQQQLQIVFIFAKDHTQIAHTACKTNSRNGNRYFQKG